MSFLMISQTGFWFSIAGLAGLLALSQILRIRYKSVPVVTNMFWREVVAEAPARAFWQRFRHFWAYLLALLIVLLLLLAFADPQKAGDDRIQDSHIFLLDGSAVMSVDGRFASSIDLLLSDLQSIPKDRRRVLMVGGRTESILVPGESIVILKQRLKDMRPQAVPSRIEQQLLHLAKFAPQGRLKVMIYGDSPVSAELLALLPDNMIVQRAHESYEIKGNSGITEVGVSEATSGLWGKVDIYYHITGQKDELIISLDGVPLDKSATSLGDGRYILHDMAATGGLLEIALAADELTIDDVSALRLPVIRPIRVQLSDSLAATLEAYFSVDPAVELVDDNPDVVIVRAGEGQNDDGDAGQIIFTPLSTQSSAFEIITDGSADDDALMSLARTLGLDQIDAGSMAEASGRAISVNLEDGDKRAVHLWSELLEDNFNFRKSRAFPLFMARSIRWLSAAEPWYAYVAAGEEIPRDMNGQPAQLMARDGLAYDTMGAGQSPVFAGDVATLRGGNDLWASLQLPVRGNAGEDAHNIRQGLNADDLVFSDLMTWILLLVIALIFTEWRLHQTGRMP